MRNAFIKTLISLAEKRSDIWLLCGDLGFSVLEDFAKRFPHRYVNVGVAEQDMAGIAAGIALSGNTVFMYSIGNFPTFRCLEQIRNDICYHGASVKVVSVGAGYAYGSQGYTHHAVEDLAVMTCLPGMEVLVPCDPAEVRVATRLIAAKSTPAYLRLSRAGEPVLHASPPEDLRRPLFLRQGKDVFVFASGPIITTCLIAADALAADGIDVAVASVPYLKPFAIDVTRDIAVSARLIVTVEEHVLRGGLHAAFAAALVGKPQHRPLIGLGIPEQVKASTGGDRDSLLARAGLSPETIAKRIKAQLPSR